MKRLIAMRHADAAHGGPSDHSRPLSDQGREQAQNVGVWLRNQGWNLDAVLASSAKRTIQTATLLLDSFRTNTGQPAPISVTPVAELYNCTIAAWNETIRKVSDDADSIIVVGHNPAVQNLISSLAGQAVPVPVATLAEIYVSSWNDLTENGRVAGVYLSSGQNILEL